MWYSLELGAQEYSMKMHSLNLNTTPTSSEIYFEANYIKGVNDPKRSNSCLNSVPSSSSLEDKSNSTGVETIPHLSSLLGLKVKDWNFDFPPCWRYKILDTKFDNDELITRVYKGIFNYFNHPDFSDPARLMEERLKSEFFEEKMILRHSGYQINHTFHNAHSALKIMTTMVNDTTKTTLKVTLRTIQAYPSERRFDDIGTFRMEMHEAQTDRINIKVSTGGYYSEYHGIDKASDKVLDAWLLDSSHVHEGAKYLSRHLIPSFMKNKMLIRSNKQLHGILSSTFARAFESLAQHEGHWLDTYYD